MNTELLKYHLVNAHLKACERDNASSVVFREVARVNGYDLGKSIAAALMTVGEKHAPIKDAYKMLELIFCNRKHHSLSDSVAIVLDEYTIVPGFGSGFVKGENDPLLAPFLYDLSNDWKEIIEEIYQYLSFKGKDLYPNLAFCNAAYAHITGEPHALSSRLFYEVRIPKWIAMLEQEIQETQELF